MKPCLALLAGALLGVEAASAQDPQKAAAVLTGDAKGSAANNPMCQLFTAAEATMSSAAAVCEGRQR